MMLLMPKQCSYFTFSTCPNLLCIVIRKSDNIIFSAVSMKLPTQK